MSVRIEIYFMYLSIYNYITITRMTVIIYNIYILIVIYLVEK